MAERRPKAARKARGEPGAGKEPAPSPERPFSAVEQALSLADRPELSGSPSGAFTYGLYCQVVRSLCHDAQDDPETVAVARIAARRALAGIAPRDALEGMIAAQLVGLHDAAMECLRRGAMARQTFEGRQMNLAQANKLARSYAALVEALDRHRGAGRPQVVRVERVTVEAGGRAIVGTVTRGEGMGRKVTDDPMQRRWPMHLSPRCGARTRGGRPCRSPAVKGRRRCRMHGGAAGGGGRPGNRNALRHGGRTAEAVALRRWAAGLVREARGLVEAVDRGVAVGR